MRRHDVIGLSPLQTVQKRKRDLLTRRGYAALGLQLCGLALGVWLVFSQVFLLHRNQGLGMFPAIRDGDLVLAYRLQQEYVKEDVVVYRLDGQLRLGRIAARGSDVVMMDDSGSLLVNGNPQSGEILYPTYARENDTYPLRVQEGTVFVLGDYRTQTQDSRDFGPIPLDDIQGKVITLIRRRGL